MAAIGYFYNAFAVDAPDNTPIPVTGSSGNPITYPYGYGADYALDLLTNPAAIPIGRTTMNQLFLDITSQLQQYSQFGTPLFITSAQNQGTNFPYPQYARVYYTDGNVYENQVDMNTTLPGVDDSWLLISGDSTGVIPGTIIDYAGVVVPTGYLACDGSAISRTTYAPLLSVLSQTQTGTTTNTVNTVSGLTSTAQMYVGMDIESANFATGTTIASIVDANNITITPVATASGAVAIQFFNWDNGDGSTTFNVPDLRRFTTIGQGGTPYAGTTAGQVNGTAVGFTGGQEAHTQVVAEIASHMHASTAYTSGGGSGGFQQGGPTVSGSINTTATGSSTPFNVMQPSAIVYKIIKT